MRLLKSILTCLLIGQSFWAIAQIHIHFDKDGKLEKVTSTNVLTDPKAYPSILSKEELHFETSNMDIPESSFWKALDDARKTLVSGGIPNPRANAAIAIQNGASTDVTRPIVATPKGALKYDPSNNKLPLAPATRNDVYQVKTTEYDLELNVTASRTPLSLLERDRIEYNLIRTKLDNDIVQQHLKATEGKYRGWPAEYDELLLELRQAFRHSGWDVDAVLVHDSLLHPTEPRHPFNRDVVENLVALTKPMELTRKFYRKVLDDNKPWIESWLWYTGGEVRLNPFPYADPAKLIVRVEREIKELESEISAMANREVSQNTGGQKDRLAFLLSRLATLKQAREDLAKVNDDYTKWLARLSVKSEVVYSGVWHGSAADSIRWLHHFDAARDFRFMNNSKKLPYMVASQDEVVIYTHNLGADDKVTITSALTAFQPKSDIENTADAIAVELTKAVSGSSSIQGLAQLVAGLGSQSFVRAKTDNSQQRSVGALPMGTSEVEFKQIIDRHEQALRAFIKDKFWQPTFRYFDQSSREYKVTYSGLKNRTELTELDVQARSMLASSANEADSTLAQAVIEVVQELKAAVQSDLKAQALAILYDYFRIEDKDAYKDLIQAYVDRKAELVWLSEQTVPILSLSQKPNTNPVYRTYAEFPEKKVAIESSNKVAYTLTLNDKTLVARQSYSKYFTTRFMPSFGLVYVFEDRSALTFDETTGQFKPQEKDFDHIEALVGVKWYPAKTNPARRFKTNSLIRKQFNVWANLSRGSSILNTLYITGGLGVRRQLLRNYYLGAGVDIIPGLSIQGGGNFIFQKQYELENAKIKSETQVIKPNWYLGLGLDLGLVTNLIRVLIP